MISALANSDFSVNRLIAIAGGSNLRAARAATASAAEPVDEPQSDSLNKSELTEGERQQVEELSRRDAEVRRHEEAHRAAAGPYARGGPQYTYETGPDNKRYAVDGKVNIDVSSIPGDPQATIAKMEQIRRAAAAPAESSGQDQAVAARAAQIETEARRELSQKYDSSPSSSTPYSAQRASTAGRFIDVAA
jgi:hypothetical protein